MSFFRPRRWLIAAGLLLAGALLVSSCGGGSTDSGPQTDPVEISWSPLDAQNLQPYMPTITVRGGDGLQEVRVSSADYDTVMNASGTSFSGRLDKEFSFDRNELPQDVSYTVTAVEADGDQVSKNFGVSVDYENLAPSGTVDVASSRIFDRTQPITVRFEDDYSLRSAFLEVGTQRYEFDVAGSKNLEETINHTFSSEGSVSYSGEVVDDEGESTQLSGEVYVVPEHDFAVQFRGFYEKNPDSKGSLTLENIETGDVFELSANNNGVVRQETFEGPHLITDISGEFYDVARMKVDRDVYGDELQFWHGNDFSYISTGVENTPLLVNVTKDMDPDFFTIETPDRRTNVYTGEDFLENISRQIPRDENGRYIVTMRPWQTQQLVLNLGNDDYSRDFDMLSWFRSGSDTDLLPEGGRLPPGSPFTSDEVSNFDEYVQDVQDVLNSSVMGLNPYTIEVVKDRAENLTDFFKGDSPYLLRLKDNVHFIGRNGGNQGFEFANDDLADFNRRFINSTLALVPGHQMLDERGVYNNTWFSNEENFLGTIFESDPWICSVKDDESAQFISSPVYCKSMFISPDGRSFKPLDKLSRWLFNGVGAFSARQPNKDYFESSSNTQILDDVKNNWSVPESSRGFNVYIYRAP